MLFNIYAMTDMLRTYNSTEDDFFKTAIMLIYVKVNIRHASPDEYREFDVAIKLCLDKIEELQNG